MILSASLQPIQRSRSVPSAIRHLPSDAVRVYRVRGGIGLNRDPPDRLGQGWPKYLAAYHSQGFPLPQVGGGAAKATGKQGTFYPR